MNELESYCYLVDSLKQDSLEHKGVKGMKWKNHVYKTYQNGKQSINKLIKKIRKRLKNFVDNYKVGVGEIKKGLKRGYKKGKSAAKTAAAPIGGVYDEAINRTTAGIGATVRAGKKVGGQIKKGAKTAADFYNYTTDRLSDQALAVENKFRNKNSTQYKNKNSKVRATSKVRKYKNRVNANMAVNRAKNAFRNI